MTTVRSVSTDDPSGRTFTVVGIALLAREADTQMAHVRQRGTPARRSQSLALNLTPLR